MTRNSIINYIYNSLFSLGVHVGHYHYSWNNSISNLFLGKRKKINILNLMASVFFLKKLYFFIFSLIRSQGHVLFLSNSDESSMYSFFMRYHALLCNEPFTYKFTGFMSNWNIIFFNFIKKLKKIMNQFQKFKYTSLILKKNNNYQLPFNKFFKKFLNIYILYLVIIFSYNLMKLKELKKLNKISRSNFSISKIKLVKKNFLTLYKETIKDKYNPFFDVLPYWRFYLLFRNFQRSKIPGSVFYINTYNSKEQMNEFFKLNIALISVVDSNSIISNISYPILGNDDSFVCNFFYSFFIANTIKLSKSPKWWNW